MPSCVRIALLGLVLYLLLPSWARAQTKQQEPPGDGVAFVPALAVSQVYDNNIFFKSVAPQVALFTRLTPALGIAYRSTPLTLDTSFSFTSELYTKELEELTNAFARRNASGSLTYRSSTKTSFVGSGGYLNTRDPSELILDTGIEFGLAPAEGYNAEFIFRHDLSARNALELGYEFQATSLMEEGENPRSFDNRSHSVRGFWRHATTPRLGFHVRYLYLRFSGTGLGVVPSARRINHSLAVTVGFDRQWTPNTSLSVEVGPRVTRRDPDDGVVSLDPPSVLTPAVSAAFDYTRESSSYSVSYERSQNQTVGAFGFVNTQSVSGRIAYEPGQTLRLGFTAGVFENSRADLVLRSFQVGGNIEVIIVSWFRLTGTVTSSIQENSEFGFEVPGMISTIRRNVAMFGFSLQNSFEP